MTCLKKLSTKRRKEKRINPLPFQRRYGCMFGATKEGEYYRTIDMLVNITGSTEKEVMNMLYFLHDSQYSNQDLKEIANLIANKK